MEAGAASNPFRKKRVALTRVTDALAKLCGYDSCHVSAGKEGRVSLPDRAFFRREAHACTIRSVGPPHVDEQSNPYTCTSQMHAWPPPEM
ncbi:hypothetical protein ACLOJK_041818 [Asimina triloba]